MFYLDQPTAKEFLAVYKGILPEYGRMLDSLIIGPSVAIEIAGGSDIVEKFRELCGPHDPQIANTLRKGTIRANFGLDRVRNAIHCTDLAEDGVLESEYFFKVLQGN